MNPGQSIIENTYKLNIYRTKTKQLLVYKLIIHYGSKAHKQEQHSVERDSGRNNMLIILTHAGVFDKKIGMSYLPYQIH